MSEKLDTLIENYVALKSDVVFPKEISSDDKEQFVNAVKKQLKAGIYEELKCELRDEALKEADKMIEKQAGLRRIEEFKKLTMDGLLLAFFVGLLVNQVTDVIGYCKGTVQMENIWPTLIITLILLFICTGFFVGMFISQLVTLIRKENDEKN